MPSKGGPSEKFAEEVVAELTRWHREVQAMPVGRQGEQRLLARQVLQKAGRQLVSPLWLTKLECSLYYANSCSTGNKFQVSVRDSAANLRRSNSAASFPAEVWPFLPLMVLSRDNRPVHLQRLQHALGLYEKTGKLTELDRLRLKTEIASYRTSDPTTFATLTERLESSPKLVDEEEDDGDWEGPETCPHCRSKKTRSRQQKQLRSGDEPETGFFYCCSCKQGFSDNFIWDQ